jgi:hypothetical protein
MKTSKMRIERFLKYLNLLVTLPIILTIFAAIATAQSTDPFSPTPMNSEIVKGRWTPGKRISHYYSFEAGPGVIKVAANCKPDGTIDGVGIQLLDADGHSIPPVENREDPFMLGTTISALAYQEGKLLVATYEIKRKQKFIVRFFTDNMEQEWGGNYSLKVSGDGVSFNGNKGVVIEEAGKDKTLGLPKSGKLRLVMDDGTVQEINLSRVREATVKP